MFRSMRPSTGMKVCNLNQAECVKLYGKLRHHVNFTVVTTLRCCVFHLVYIFIIKNMYCFCNCYNVLLKVFCTNFILFDLHEYLVSYCICIYLCAYILWKLIHSMYICNEYLSYFNIWNFKYGYYSTYLYYLLHTIFFCVFSGEQDFLYTKEKYQQLRE